MPRWISRFKSRVLCLSVLTAITVTGMNSGLLAQEPSSPYFLLDQRTPLGQAAAVMGFQNPNEPARLQPIRFDLPTSGQVTFFCGPDRHPSTIDSKQLASVAPGHVYRLRLSHLPEFPGLELFPTIEILDRLHPPAGQELSFPVPVAITPEEIDHALNGRLITKVVYLEQPQLAVPDTRLPREAVEDVPSDRNLLVEADLRGRPLIILRIGGRQPGRTGSSREFFGPPAPLALPANAGQSPADGSKPGSAN